MFSKFSFLFCFIMCCYCYHNSFKISLFRQKTPRENMLDTPNIPEHDIWLDWVKKPKPRNRTNDTIPLMRYLDSEFYGIINVGSPGQEMKVIFDTAWTTSWVLSKDCPTKSIGCWFHSKFNHDQSSTYNATNKTYLANEGTYNLTGYYSRDRIVAGQSLINQTFVEMVGVPYWNVFTKADGVIGLAMDRGDGVTPFFYNMLRQTKIKTPIFSIYLNRDRSSPKGGSIYFGGIDGKHVHHINKTVKENITYAPVNTDSTNWEFNMDSVNLWYQNKSIPVCDADCVAFADTSSNSIITTKDYLKIINQHIRAKPLYFGRYEVDCNTINQMPHITFVISGEKFNLTGTDYVQKVSAKLVTVCISAFVEGTATSDKNHWLLGGAFLSKFFSIYDLEKKRIGFVLAA
ncbi:lysosomal aspartic protease-like [Onthophagus taurus]|uniref:lysosomal aspartic protease-like n=1 Tax=Onthophagus taurus TaxID=166361 RepID=UPI000C20C2AF|nr:lysosomal aspartic protease-like [Onthophagus taurus]